MLGNQAFFIERHLAHYFIIDVMSWACLSFTILLIYLHLCVFGILDEKGSKLLIGDRRKKQAINAWVVVLLCLEEQSLFTMPLIFPLYFMDERFTLYIICKQHPQHEMDSKLHLYILKRIMKMRDLLIPLKGFVWLHHWKYNTLNMRWIQNFICIFASFNGIMMALLKWSFFWLWQGVHDIFQGSPDRLWGADEARVNKIVFIGKNLNTEELEKGFKACLLWCQQFDPKFLTSDFILSFGWLLFGHSRCESLPHIYHY